MTKAISAQEGTNQQRITGAHSLHIDRRKKVAVTGVADVCSYHENEIVLKLDSGLMILCGQNLHIGRLMLEEGKLDVDGHVDSVIYESPGKKAGLFGKILGRQK